MSDRAPRGSDYAAVALAAGAGLTYEILLLRVFSYSQWHHFASLAVSLALLGFGAAGTLLTLLGPRAIRWGDRLFAGGLLIGGLGMLGAFLLPHAITVRPLFAVWDWRELGRLALIDVVSFIPFFGLALSLGQAFMRFPEATPRLYAVNLAGSGLGSLAAFGLLSGFFLEEAIVGLAAVILAAAGALCFRRRANRWIGAGGLALAGGAVAWMVIGLPGLALSDFKRLSYLLDVPDAQILSETADPRAKLTVVRSDSIRIAPGLSLRWTEPVPSVDALALDADRVIPLPRGRESLARFEHRRSMLGRLPFALRSEGRAGVVGTSEWLSLFQAPERETIWVENHPGVIAAMEQRGLLENITPVSSGARPFLERDSRTYSVLVHEISANALDAATEDYAMTTEALTRALGRLAPGGVLAVPLSLSQPPRYAPKLMAMLDDAVERAGLGETAPRAAMLRSMYEGLFLVSESPWTEADRATIRRFADENGFDLVALPGLERGEANRFHRLDEPVCFEAARAIWQGEGRLPAAASWRVLEPARDAQPYFWRSMQWDTLPELIDQLGRPGLVFLDWGLLALAAKMIVVAGLGAVLILLPLGRLPRVSGAPSRGSAALYFTFLGLGFLLLEMAVFQRSLLYLDHPVMAAAVVFGVFLIGSGLGSWMTPAAANSSAVGRIFIPVLGGAGLVMAIAFAGSGWLWRMNDHGRLIAVCLLALPLAWSLGRPMPWGLRRLDDRREMIPWAWGINGFASVMAGPLAAMAAIHFSQWATWALGGACYLGAAAVALRWARG